MTLTKQLFNALNFALDAAPSRRRYDVNGFLHVDACHIAKEKVYPYTGDELAELEGIDPDGVYYAYLPAPVIQNALTTFEGLPLLLDHHDESAAEPAKAYRVGSTGTDAAYRAPYLDVSLHITDAEAIRRVESGEQREISIGFFATYAPAAGIFNGEAYDFVISRLTGNHVALVPEGRAGHDVLVADAAPNSQGFAHWLKQHNLTRTVKSWPRS